MNLKTTTISTVIALLILIWGCSPPTSQPPTPGKQHVDKANEAVEALEERNKKQQEQINNLPQSQ